LSGVESVGVKGFEPSTSWSRTKNEPSADGVETQALAPETLVTASEASFPSLRDAGANVERKCADKSLTPIADRIQAGRAPTRWNEKRRPHAGKITVQQVADFAVFPFKKVDSSCYILLDGGTIVYVGQSINLGGRVYSHLTDKLFDAVRYLSVPRAELDDTEACLIWAFRPKYNFGLQSQMLGYPAAATVDGVLRVADRMGLLHLLEKSRPFLRRRDREGLPSIDLARIASTGGAL
jgi:hypothetical protein